MSEKPQNQSSSGGKSIHWKGLVEEVVLNLERESEGEMEEKHITLRYIISRPKKTRNILLILLPNISHVTRQDVRNILH